MNESENLEQWSRLVAVTQIECVDHAAMLGCFGGRLWANCAAVCKKLAVLEAVIYLNCNGLLWSGQIRNGSPGLACSKRARPTRCMATAMGQSRGLIVSQKKGIFSPLCLFFCVCHQMHTEATVVDGCMMILATGISPSRKNSKSLAMKASGGCEGQEAMHL